MPLDAVLTDELRAYIKQLPVEDLAVFNHRADWLKTARQAQRRPPGDWWTIWLILAGRGFGKGLDLATEVWTPRGLTTMGELRTGDYVYAHDGRKTKVVAHDPYMPKTLYELTFSTGETVVADGDHLWFTQRGKERSKGRGKVRDTAELFKTQLNTGSRVVPQHYVPTAGPTFGSKQHLLISPYILGLWLGDGTTKGGYLCIFEDELVKLVQAEGYLTHSPPSSPNAVRIERGGLKLATALKELGLFGNKHIPEQYLKAPFEDRLALLQGLMDTDGAIHKDGLFCSFGNTNKRLIDSVHLLVASLGLKPRTRYKLAKLKRPGKPDYNIDSWKVDFTAYDSLPVFRLSRKLLRQKAAGDQADRHKARTIVAVKQLEPRLVRCLTVDHPGKLYLVTRGLIPTHNTRVGAEESLVMAMTAPKQRVLVAAPTSGDVRDTCFEGESGILEIMPKELYKKGCYVRSLHELNLPNGSLIKGIPASEPERFRGPQWHYAWCDELAAWQYLKDAWDMIMFSLRLGPHPRLLATTTPKPLPLLRDLIKRIGKDVVMSRGSTYENRANLAPTFFNQVTQYEGTELGRQELHAELLDPEESGIIKRRWFQLWPADKALPRFDFVLPSLDTALTEDQKNDPTASQTWGIFQPASGMPHAAMLIDAWEERLEFPELIQRCKDEFNTSYGEPSEWLLAQQPLVKSKLGPTYLGDTTEVPSGRRPDMMVIENTVAKPVIQVLQRQKLPIIPYNPGNVGKLQRLHMVSHIAKSRRLWLPESKARPGQPRDWCEPVLSQVCSFHGEESLEHDDHVDSFSQAIRTLADLGWLHADPTSLVTVMPEVQEPHEERARNPYAA